MKDERGVTLIEMVLTIVILGIIGWIAADAFLFSTRSVLTADSVREAAQGNRLGMDRMIREIRTVRDNRCVAVATPMSFSFVDSENNTIAYIWSGTAGDPLDRTENAVTNTLVGNVTSLAFTYYNNADPPVAITSPPGPLVCPGPAPATCASACAATDIWSIQIDLTTQSGTETMPLRSRVQPRGLE